MIHSEKHRLVNLNGFYLQNQDKMTKFQCSILQICFTIGKSQVNVSNGPSTITQFLIGTRSCREIMGKAPSVRGQRWLCAQKTLRRKGVLEHWCQGSLGGSHVEQRQDREGMVYLLWRTCHSLPYLNQATEQQQESFSENLRDFFLFCF